MKNEDPTCCIQINNKLLKGLQVEQMAQRRPTAALRPAHSSQVPTCPRRRRRRHRVSPWVGQIPWSREWQPTPVFLPGKFHGQRSLAGYSTGSYKELDTTEYTHLPPSLCQLHPPTLGNQQIWIQVPLLALGVHSLLWAQCHHPQNDGARKDHL